jgi:UDP-N-acetylglucosamine transferase subunit ALG13
MVSERTLWRSITLSTFVSVGNANQPFYRLINSVVDNSGQLPSPVFIQFGSASPNLRECQGAPFLDMDEFERRVAEATLLIMHAGAGSVIHAIRAGKVPVVMPRLAEYDEHVDNHQVEFTHEMNATGKIVACSNPKNLVLAATESLSLQGAMVCNSKPPILVDMVRQVLDAALCHHARSSAKRVR